MKTIIKMWAMPRPMGKYMGTFPKGIFERIQKLGIDIYNKKVLFNFGGITERRKSWTILDINPEVKPDVVGDARKLPFKDNSFDIVFSDPPYFAPTMHLTSKGMKQRTLQNPYWERYGEEFVKPYEHFKESFRVVKEGGYILILDFLVYKKLTGSRRHGVIGITTGSNMRIRVLNIFQKLNTLKRFA